MGRRRRRRPQDRKGIPPQDGGGWREVRRDLRHALPTSATGLLKEGGFSLASHYDVVPILNKIKLLFSSKKSGWIDLVECKRSDLEIIAGMLTSGQADVPIDSTYKIKDIAEAAARNAGKKTGRVVVQVENGWD